MSPQKFLFDRHFDNPDEKAKPRQAKKPSVAPKPKAAPQPAPPPPVIKTYEDGFKAGQLEAETTLTAEFQQQLQAIQHEQQQEALLEKMTMQLQELRQQQTDFCDGLKSYSLQLATAYIKKLFPEWHRQHGKTEAISALKSILAQTEQEKRLLMRVHPDDLEFFQQTTASIIEDFALQAELILKEDTDLQPGDIKVRWSGGGAEYLPQQYLNQITTISQVLTENNPIKPKENNHE